MKPKINILNCKLQKLQPKKEIVVLHSGHKSNAINFQESETHSFFLFVKSFFGIVTCVLLRYMIYCQVMGYGSHCISSAYLSYWVTFSLRSLDGKRPIF